jgi:uncharacterized protein
MIRSDQKSPSFSADQLVPLSELQKAPGRYVKQACDQKIPLLITQRGRPKAVLLDFADYEGQWEGDEEKREKGTQRKKELRHALAEMLPVIIQQYRPEKIILFGSLATGEVTESSDIDLLIIKKTKKRSLDRRKEVLQLVRPQIAVDFFVYTPHEFAQAQKEMRPFFVEEIKTKGQVLYEKVS